MGYADGVTYNPHARSAEILGGPGWVRDDYYSIDAKADSTATRFQMLGPMTRALIEDRFKLRFHRTTKTVPVYLLTVAKGGARVQPAKEGGCAKVGPTGPPPATA